MLMPVKYHCLDCSTFKGAVKGKIEVTEIENLSCKIPHVGYGGGSKSKYVSPKGQTIYVLERNNWYTGDAYINDVWQFDRDFTAEEADEFITQFDQEQKMGGMRDDVRIH